MEAIGFLVCFIVGFAVGFFVCDKGKKKIKAKVAEMDIKYNLAVEQLREALKKGG